MATTDALFTWGPLANIYIGANPATPDYDGEVPVLDFDTGTDEVAEFTGVMPAHYAGTTGVTLTIYSQATSATSGNFAWEAQFNSITTAVDSPGVDSYATVNTTGAVATDGVAGVMTVSTITFTDGADMDNVAAGESFKLRINRDVGIASDHAGDRELFMLQLKET